MKQMIGNIKKCEGVGNHTKSERAYLAGMIDADGSIMLNHARTHYEVRVDICQASTENLIKLQKIWGGRITRGTRGNHLIWGNRTEAKYILESVLHFLKFKVDQAGIILLYISDVMPGIGHPINKEKADYLKNQLAMLREEFYAC